MAAKKTSHVFVALVSDAVLVALFAVIGYYTHAQNLDADGITRTAWPFLLGLGAAWVLNAAWSAPLSPLRTGTGVWAATVLIGMVVRAFIGEGTAGSFIIVASVLNFITLVGWRTIASAVAGRSARR